jgi:hypothetical protein
MPPYRRGASLLVFAGSALAIGECGCSASSSSAAPVEGTSTGGTPTTSNTTDCVEGRTYPRPETFCSSDNDCDTDGSCSGAVEGNTLTCQNGRLVASSYIVVRTCESYPRDCGSSESALKAHLTDTECTVMVRASADIGTLLGYAVNCGLPTAVTESDALGRLLPMSSINWAGATAITDSQTTGLIALRVVNDTITYDAYFSAATGNQLLLTQTLDADAGTGSFRQDVAWYDPIELGTSCVTNANSSLPAPYVDSSASRTKFEKAWFATVGTNLLPTTRLNFRPIDTWYETTISVGDREVLLFFNSHCVRC